jgi:hypothetical protein
MSAVYSSNQPSFVRPWVSLMAAGRPKRSVHLGTSHGSPDHALPMQRQSSNAFTPTGTGVGEPTSERSPSALVMATVAVPDLMDRTRGGEELAPGLLPIVVPVRLRVPRGPRGPQRGGPHLQISLDWSSSAASHHQRPTGSLHGSATDAPTNRQVGGELRNSDRSRLGRETPRGFLPEMPELDVALARRGDRVGTRREEAAAGRPRDLCTLAHAQPGYAAIGGKSVLRSDPQPRWHRG